MDRGSISCWKSVIRLPSFTHSFPGSSGGKESACMRETWVWSLGREDPLKKEMATHSSIHVWKIQWTEKPCMLQSMGSQRVGHNWATNTSVSQWIYPWKTDPVLGPESRYTMGRGSTLHLGRLVTTPPPPTWTPPYCFAHISCLEPQTPSFCLPTNSFWSSNTLFQKMLSASHM